MHGDDRDPDAIAPVSKSQRKRDVEELQVLGERLVGLAPARLARIPLPEPLRDAVRAAQAISSRGARRRQLQFIGRIMRDTDTAPIRAALGALEGTDREAKARLQRMERWRERLIDEGDAALGELVEQFPNADRQHLRRLVRDARRERDTGKPPTAARAMFRYLRGLADR